MLFSFKGPEKKVTDVFEDTCTVPDDMVSKEKDQCESLCEYLNMAALYPKNVFLNNLSDITSYLPIYTIFV